MENPNDRCLFAKTDWTAAGLAAIVALTLYFITLAPTVTLEQSGAFAVAGQHLGIGRAPGYPLWHLLAKGFITAFGFVHYRGHPNPAWATNFMSAVFGALSCGLIALLVARVGRAMATTPPDPKAKASVAGLAAGVLFATSRTMWSQSVITETHTLTLFCILLFLVAAAAWIRRPSRGSALCLAASLGLGLAQSHIVVLLVPSLALALLLAEPRLCREFCLANVFLWIFPCILLRLGLPKAWFLVALASSCLLGLALPLRLSAFGGTALGMLLVAACGLAFYAYLPLASEVKAPMQFGYARTWEGFAYVFTRGQYESIRPAHVFAEPLALLSQLKWYLGLYRQQFMFPASLVALLPLAGLTRFRGTWRKWWAVCLLTLFMFSVILLIGASPKGDLQDAFIQRVKFIPSFALWSIFFGLGLMLIMNWIGRLAAPEHGQPVERNSLSSSTVLFFRRALSVRLKKD